MNYFHASLGVFLSILALCHSQTNLKCGTIITTASGGVLNYKLGETYVTAEKCVWTVRGTSSSYFKFTKESSDFGQNDTYLSIHTFRNGGSVGNGVLGQIEGQQVLYLKGSVAVIVFTASTADNVLGKGFRLKFETLGDPDPRVSSGHDYILTNETATLQYPTLLANGTRPDYDNNMLTTIVLSTNYMRNTALSRRNKLSVQFPEADIMPFYGDDCQTSCGCDALAVYQVVEAELQPITRYCDTGPSGQFEAEDLLIAVFTTNGDDKVASGFEMYWEMY